ncbi:MAG: TetR family transcriptional regulator [Candidatus Nanopelagicales bacterium]
MSDSDDVRRQLLDAARSAYAARGFIATTFKGVAAAAGVAPEVARNYYDSREELFAAAMRLPFEPASALQALLAPGLDGMGERLVRTTMSMFSDPQTREQLAELVRAGAGASKATAAMREFLDVAVVDRAATALGVPDARMRVVLATSYLLGAATSRYVLKLEPLASASDEEVVRLLAPVVQATLTGH